jgi:hypothetical protein
MRKYHIALIACLPAFFWSTFSHAVVVNIDSFSAQFINSSGELTSFKDTFDDGPPPPCGPANAGATCTVQTGFYGVNSQNPLPNESNSFLQLDSSNGIFTHNATGGARLNETVQVSGDKSKLPRGSEGISMTGIFTLPSLSGPWNEGYGIRFIDGAPGGGPGNNEWDLQLNVQWWTGNASNQPGWYIRFLTQDFNTHQVQTIGAILVDIPPGADGISLSLDLVRDSTNLFEATYAYGFGGTFDPPTPLGTAEGFVYNDYVRAQFHAFETVVPEPETWSLIGLGLIALLAARRRVAP